MSLTGTPLSELCMDNNPGTNITSVQNGRINFQKTRSSGGSTTIETVGFGYPKSVGANFKNDMLRGNWESTPLSDAFFTKRNVATIQESIRTIIYQKSGSKKYEIDDQDADELQIIMRAIFLQYAKNRPYDIDGQVRELNKMIIDWCIPKILSEIDHYLYYLNDVSKMPSPLQHPVHLSSAGTRSLPFQPYM